MVVATEAELLLPDEPTAGMGAMESTQTADIVKTLVGEHAVLVIDHDIDFVAQLNGHVVVLHQGRLLREGTLDAIRADEEVAAISLGRAQLPTCSTCAASAPPIARASSCGTSPTTSGRVRPRPSSAATASDSPRSD